MIDNVSHFYVNVPSDISQLTLPALIALLHNIGSVFFSNKRKIKGTSKALEVRLAKSMSFMDCGEK